MPRTNWITVPAGRFRMGAQSQDPALPNYDPEAEPTETVSNWITVASFALGRIPVTVEEYARFAEQAGPTATPRNWAAQLEHPQRPVVLVTHQQAQAYCEWAGGRLPTEVEWEFAARGEECRRFPWGDTPPPNETLAAFEHRCGDLAVDAGSFPAGATPLGLLDMAGNVFEWTSTPYDGETFVMRGGAFDCYPITLRCAFRYWIAPNDIDESFGFRIAR